MIPAILGWAFAYIGMGFIVAVLIDVVNPLNMTERDQGEPAVTVLLWPLAAVCALGWGFVLAFNYIVLEAADYIRHTKIVWKQEGEKK